jgi:hypothetical protein
MWSEGACAGAYAKRPVTGASAQGVSREVVAGAKRLQRREAPLRMGGKVATVVCNAYLLMCLVRGV